MFSPYEDTVLIEEWDKSHSVLAHHLKLWADRYPFNAEVKGGTTGKIRPKRIVVTSNYHPRDIWGDDPEGALGPILRRFNVTHFDTKFNNSKNKACHGDMDEEPKFDYHN